MTASTRLEAGDRVTTPRGAGRVVYVRLAPPDYRTIAAVSVALDSCAHRPTYSGSIFGASDVTREAAPAADRRARALEAHRAADPHCTCPDCIAFHFERSGDQS